MVRVLGLELPRKYASRRRSRLSSYSRCAAPCGSARPRPGSGPGQTNRLRAELGPAGGQSDIDFATAQRIISHEFPNPTLAVSTEKINVDRGSGTTMGNGFWDRSYDTIAAVNQLFEIGGKRASRQSSARAGVEGAAARLADARRVLDLAVTKAYIAALQSETNVVILRDSAASLRTEAAIADARLKAGDISLADKSQIEIAADRLELDAQAAKAAATTARIALDVLLGKRIRPATGHRRIPSNRWRPCACPSCPWVRLRCAPIWKRPKRPCVKRRPTCASKRPCASPIRPSCSCTSQPPDAPNTIGLGFSIPVPLWNRNRGAIQAATASRAAAALQVGKVKGQIAGEVHTANVTYAGCCRQPLPQATRRNPAQVSARPRDGLICLRKGGRVARRPLNRAAERQ